ncbi:DUF2490 domain-containing protein [Tamlana sp. s12]|uniref:DUF2490 domain-containing protein n=1 Tax=Tamlana sp. s12 TaxID=1630406 RepID=UPI0007FF431A|nr:DUF2490 domain-containing protein [Tamlana sp. s12]OBQ57263.1 hypothetical protein VQ01_01965 [Tamlana sp. s12]QQY82547.1 DUF2490 domain-containing protein [Tamlana sp. s12]
MAFSQKNTTLLGETTVGVTHQFSQKYSTDFAFRSRYFLYQHHTWDYNQQQIDFYHFSNFHLNDKHIASLGIYYRNRDFFDTGSGEIRITEKYTYINQHKRLRYRHKLRFEQRFLKTLTIYRERYLFEVGLPLKGSTFDVGESYFTSSVEGLLSLSPQIKALTSLRTNAKIAWKITEKLKLRTGIEYRLETFNRKAYNVLFLLTSALIKL